MTESFTDDELWAIDQSLRACIREDVEPAGLNALRDKVARIRRERTQCGTYDYSPSVREDYERD